MLPPILPSPTSPISAMNVLLEIVGGPAHSTRPIRNRHATLVVRTALAFTRELARRELGSARSGNAVVTHAGHAPSALSVFGAWLALHSRLTAGARLVVRRPPGVLAAAIGWGPRARRNRWRLAARRIFVHRRRARRACGRISRRHLQRRRRYALRAGRHEEEREHSL